MAFSLKRYYCIYTKHLCDNIILYYVFLFFFPAFRIQKVLAVHPRAVHCSDNGVIGDNGHFRTDRSQVEFDSRTVQLKKKKSCKIAL